MEPKIDFFELLSEALRPMIHQEMRAVISEMKRDEPPDRMTAKEAAAFLNIALCTLYSKVSKGHFDGCYSKKFKSLIFSRKKLQDYLR
jgi:hypothetical protein